MNDFFGIVAGVLLAVVLGLVLSKQGKDIALLLNMGVCCMLLIAGAYYLEPVLSFLQKLQEIGNLDENLMGIMFKAVGIGLVGEIASLICADSGNSALGKGIQFLASIMILWLGIPLMTGVIELVQGIMGEI